MKSWVEKKAKPNKKYDSLKGMQKDFLLKDKPETSVTSF